MKSSLLAILGLFVVSFFLTAFGQPSWIFWCGPLAALCGYALFWRGLLEIEKLSRRFWIATLWYALVQSIQLSWMTAVEFQGIYILFVHLGTSVWLGLQFGLFCLLLPRTRSGVAEMPALRVLALASMWTLIEWSRLYFLCGFSFNPAGMALTCSLASMQFASVFGVYGLTFWVMLTNGFVLKILCQPLKKWRLNTFALRGMLALMPYFFGALHLAYFGNKPASSTLDVALVQTGLLPSQKVPLQNKIDDFINPWDQWKRVLIFLKQTQKKRLDLIVMPEAAIPFLSDQAIYPVNSVLKILYDQLGQGILRARPELEAPYAQKKKNGDKEEWFVSNLYWAQAIANFYQAELIAGLDAKDLETKKNYNAAFHIRPHQNDISRYEKRILVPLAEYLPFHWLVPFVKMYGISEFFTPGTQAKIFDGKVPVSVSICYEETFPSLVREGRLAGARLLVNVTNDNWYPSSRLASQHFDHGRLRSVENGVPLLRACNTGTTAAIDSFGRVLCKMEEKTRDDNWAAGAIIISLPLDQHFTLYTFWGDLGILGISISFCCAFFFRRLYQNIKTPQIINSIFVQDKACSK